METLINDTEIKIEQFADWVKYQIQRYELDVNEFGPKWLFAICECICQRRRHLAPIDEPTTEWVETFIKILKDN